MLKKLVLSLFIGIIAAAWHENLTQTVPGDTLTYYLDGKLVSAAYFQTLGANTLAFIDVNKQAKTIRGFIQDVAPADAASYQAKGPRIDWSVAKELRDVSFIINNRVVEAPEARALTSEQIERVYQLPPTMGSRNEIGSFGKNGVTIITTKKR